MTTTLEPVPEDWERALAQRLQPSRESLDAEEMRTYRRELVTPTAGLNRRHELRLAF